MAILAIANLLVEGSLNYVSISVRDIVSTLVKLITDSFSYSVEATRHHKRGILNSQKAIGENIGRHTNDGNGKLARVPN